MLTAEDAPTIRNAIQKRLGTEPGVAICDIRVASHDYGAVLRVGIMALLDGEAIVTRSLFELPNPFELGHLHDEIDEIAEQYKAARKAHYGRGGAPMVSPEKHLAGTGMRGRWARYGLRNG
jgi:hypothetical protein